MRTFGVEEELLLVRADTFRPLSLADAIVRRCLLSSSPTGHDEGVHRVRPSLRECTPDHQLRTELQQEQLEVVCPPRRTLAEQIESIRVGRALADEAAKAFHGRVVAMGTPASPRLPHIAEDLRYRRIGKRFGLLAAEQLTCGFHVHVEIDSREEGVQVLDRIRVWLPVLLAMSANSPFWYGRDSDYSSFRYQYWSQWPTAGPRDVFGSVDAYDCQVQSLLRAGAALDDGMMYFDARLSARYPTVEIRVADVCADAEQAAVVATLARALVETAARERKDGRPVTADPDGCVLRAWTWLAARDGLEGHLVSPLTGTAQSAGHVVAQFLGMLNPVLAEQGEADQVERVVCQMLQDGTGCRGQREAYSRKQDCRDVVEGAVRRTHASPPPVRAVSAPVELTS